jgi:hypothetical protein
MRLLHRRNSQKAGHDLPHDARFPPTLSRLLRSRPAAFSGGNNVQPLLKGLALVAFAFTTLSAHADDDQVQPRVVLIERYPWAMLMGSESPTLALYADGQVIFHREGGGQELLSASLTAADYEAFVGRLAPVRLLQLADRYAASEATDQPLSELHLWTDGQRKSIAIYGDWRRAPDARARVPAELLTALDAIAGFRTPARPWLPDQIEVLLWPFDYAETSTPWPADWPDFSQARQRGNELGQIFLPSTQYRRLRTFLASLAKKEAVEFGGRKCVVAFRLPFPGEEAWLR